ncbi:hypothetical protein DB32_006585 [Sandaracinus amylolyticus]|uniref:Uncharacterized protein n=1 Tax=Sandaracinus amylolyticus TaxID=927083 RepID=A0A0F6W7J6_9BACT|nr:hypothetical protein DB32_006585 [Sandaracinus amylolyticus]
MRAVGGIDRPRAADGRARAGGTWTSTCTSTVRPAPRSRRDRSGERVGARALIRGTR